MKINASPWLHVLSAALGGALPVLAGALPQYMWLWGALGVLTGGTAFVKADK